MWQVAKKDVVEESVNDLGGVVEQGDKGKVRQHVLACFFWACFLVMPHFLLS